MRYGVKILLGLSMAANLAACGDRNPGGTTAQLPKEDVAAAEIERFQAAENARSRITMIDGASGDAAAMPGEWSGPTAYDLRPKDGKSKAVASTEREPDDPKPSAADVFPSVAE